LAAAIRYVASRMLTIGKCLRPGVAGRIASGAGIAEAPRQVVGVDDERRSYGTERVECAK
jgi:hypothetical protein